FEGGLLPEGQQGRAELVLAAQLSVGAFAGEQVADHLGLERGGENPSCASWHAGDSLGASIHIVLVSPKGRSSYAAITFQGNALVGTLFDHDSDRSPFRCEEAYKVERFFQKMPA